MTGHRWRISDDTNHHISYVVEKMIESIRLKKNQKNCLITTY